MRGKMWFLGGVAVGFVIGARAGRERYDQLVQTARQLREHPTVQEAAGVVQEQANRIYAGGKETVSERLGHTKFGERRGRREHAPGEMGTPGAADTEETLAGTTRKPPGSTL